MLKVKAIYDHHINNMSGEISLVEYENDKFRWCQGGIEVGDIHPDGSTFTLSELASMEAKLNPDIGLVKKIEIFLSEVQCRMRRPRLTLDTKFEEIDTGPKTCTCELFLMMRAGCQCGGI